MIDKYGNLYANDTICRRFLKLGFPFKECQLQRLRNPIEIFYEDTDWDVSRAFYRPLLTTINDWLAFGNIEERTKRDEQLEDKLINMIKEGLL